MTIHGDDEVELTDEQRAERLARLEAELAALVADDTDYIAFLAERMGHDRAPTTWRPVDLAAALEEARHGVDSPSLLCRSDRRHLLYAGRVHSVAGEPEAGKTWLALLLVAQCLGEGLRCLWVDYEDSASGVLGRLDALGIPEASILGGAFAYIRPDEPLATRQGVGTAAAFDFELVVSEHWDVVVLDGVTEALVVEGFDPNSNADVASWQRRVIKRFVGTGGGGPAVLTLDHLVKPGGEGGPPRYAIGAQHKLAGLTGAGYRLEMLKPFRRAVGTDVAEGLARVVVTKDRPGHVRGVSEGDVAAMFSFAAYPDGGVKLALDPLVPNAAPGPVDRRLVNSIIEFLLVYDGATTRAISAAKLGARSEAIRETLRAMASPPLLLIRVEPSGNAHRHFLTDAGRAWSPSDVDRPDDAEGGF